MEETNDCYARGRSVTAPDNEWTKNELGSSFGPTVAESDDGVQQKDIDTVLDAAFGDDPSPPPRSHKNAKRNVNSTVRRLPWWERFIKWLGSFTYFMILVMMLPNSTIASTWYVHCNGGLDSNDGKSKTSAFATLEKAISVAAKNDTIVLGDGTYTAVSLSNNEVLITSENGFKQTIIDCSTKKDWHLWPYTNTGISFSNVTLANGGMLNCGPSSTFEHCLIKNFSGYVFVMCNGIAKNCLFLNNSLSGNKYSNYGVLNNTTAYNCTIYGSYGYDAANATLYNCILTGEVNSPTSLIDCYTGDPRFINASKGDFRLASGSPCRNAGNNSYASSSDLDMAGNPRIAEGRVDIGAYEYIPYFDVTFNIGKHGYIISGEANQSVENGSCPMVPTVEASNGWEIVRWIPDPTIAVESNTTYIAEYIHYQCGNPCIGPASGSFSDVSVDVSITCATEDSVIFYTLDGSTPSKENGHRYTAPLALYKTTTVRAIAVRADWADSAIIESVYIREDSIGEAANLLQCPMENDGAYPWSVDAEVSHDGVSAIKSGGAGVKNVASVAATSVKRAGTVRFWWKADCEESDDGDYYDYLAFIVDDKVVDKLAGKNTAWEKVTYEIPTGGKHVLRWEYRKDGATSRYSDCGWVDQIEWIPADDSGHTVTTIKPIPYSWLQKFNFGTDTDFETAAKEASGKSQSGIETSVFDEFWIGTDPTNQNSKLTATIDMTSGIPIINWIPDLSTNDMMRSYKIWGKTTLDGEDEWMCPTNSMHRFFKVSIDIP